MFNKALLFSQGTNASTFQLQVGSWLDEIDLRDCRGFSSEYSAGTLEPAQFDEATILRFQFCSFDAGILDIPAPTVTPECHIKFDRELPSKHLRVTINGQEYMFYAYGGLLFQPTEVDSIYVRVGDELEIKLELVFYS